MENDKIIHYIKIEYEPYFLWEFVIADLLPKQCISGMGTFMSGVAANYKHELLIGFILKIVFGVSQCLWM